MNRFNVIPAIDLLDGSVVRLYQGDYNRATAYPVDPINLAKQFLGGGLSHLHLVDLEGARSGTPTQLDLVSKIAGTGIHIELGGGIRSERHIQQAIDAGASEVILGTALLENQPQVQTWLDKFGSRLVAAVDSRDGSVFVNGWLEKTNIDSIDLLCSLEQLGFSRAIVTDIATDGAPRGPNLPFLASAAATTTMSITASGGIGRPEHLQSVAQLFSQGLDGIIVGRAFYEGAVTIAQMAQC